MKQRIRTIKPELFRHEVLYDLEVRVGLPVRLGFIGLLTVCDREGRFLWRPRELKVMCMPYDEVDFGLVLGALEGVGMVVRYEVGGGVYGYVPSWGRHQAINVREAKSEIPAPEVAVERTCVHVQARGEGKGKEGKGTEVVVGDVGVWPGFDDWWDLYGKKADRKKCEMRWGRLGQVEREAIMEHTRLYVTVGRGGDVRYRRDPGTYLNNENWKDEELIKPRTDGKQVGTIFDRAQVAGSVARGLFGDGGDGGSVSDSDDGWA